MMDGGNRRRSVSQVVIGFSDEHRAALREHDGSVEQSFKTDFPQWPCTYLG